MAAISRISPSPTPLEISTLPREIDAIATIPNLVVDVTLEGFTLGSLIIVGSNFLKTPPGPARSDSIVAALAARLELQLHDGHDLSHRLPVGHNLIDFTIEGATVNGNRLDHPDGAHFFELVGPRGYDAEIGQLLGLLGERNFSEQDVVIYGCVGAEEIASIMKLGLLQLDRAVGTFVQTHRQNLQRLQERGCQRVILIYAWNSETEAASQETQEILAVLLNGRRGLFNPYPSGLKLIPVPVTDLRWTDTASVVDRLETYVSMILD